MRPIALNARQMREATLLDFFSSIDYPEGENAFTMLRVEHEARTNVGAQIATADSGGVEPGTYRNRFGCVRDSVPVVPHATALPAPHTAALVVGVPNGVATTMRDHQVRVPMRVVASKHDRADLERLKLSIRSAGLRVNTKISCCCTSCCMVLPCAVLRRMDHRFSISLEAGNTNN